MTDSTPIAAATDITPEKNSPRSLRAGLVERSDFPDVRVQEWTVLKLCNGDEPLEAEDIKCKYGCALSQLADVHQNIDVAGVDDRPSRSLSRRALADVIQPRVEELYELIQNELRRAGFEEVLSSGIVLTGGASVMPGMVELGEEIFHMPVRLGNPKY